MKEYILSFVAVAVLLVILELILSDGSTKKYISGIVRLILVFTLISPIFILITNMDTQTDSFVNFVNETISSETNSYSLCNTDELTMLIEKKIEKIINEEIGNCSVEIVGNENLIKKIEIRLNNKVINEGEDNIFIIEKIRKTVKQIVTIDESAIIIKMEKKINE